VLAFAVHGKGWKITRVFDFFSGAEKVFGGTGSFGSYTENCITACRDVCISAKLQCDTC
jgi:hypothetical protein